MTKKIAIIQSNYIPWKGYFDIINMVDEFVLYDDVQYTKNDWRNRNKIKTSQGIQWLTIPVRQRNITQKIIETKITDKKWNTKHWRSIAQNYNKTKHFNEYKDIFENLFLNCNEQLLSNINYKFITTINNILDITTKITWSSQFKLEGKKSDKLINICKQSDATEYISGPVAQNYLDTDMFLKEGIKITWMEYNNYKEYNQLHPPFDHFVSILDLIFNEGENANNFMKSFKL